MDLLCWKGAGEKCVLPWVVLCSQLRSNQRESVGECLSAIIQQDVSAGPGLLRKLPRGENNFLVGMFLNIQRICQYSSVFNT